MKKRLFLLSALFTLSIPLFAFNLTAIAQGDFKTLDIPLVDGIAYFQNTIGDFRKIAITLSTLIGLIGILWNVFRMWMGTQEVKKAAIDIALKFLLFTFLMNAYPVLVDEVISLSMGIGSKVGGGYNKVNAAFYTLAADCEKKIKISQDKIKKILETGEPGSAISLDELKNITARTNLTEEQLKSFLADKNITVVSSEDIKNLDNGKWWNKFFMNNDQAELNNKLWDFYLSTGLAAAQELYNDKDLQQAIVTMKAFEDVLIKKETEEITDKGISKVTSYLYNPFLTDNQGRQTQLLSPGAMIKTAVMISDIINRQGSTEYRSDKNGFFAKQFDKTFQSILNFILLTCMTLGLVFASIFCVIQYIMCIFEYFIVTSIGVVFIPFILWDGTKSFTSKLVTLFTSYFIKIMVMVMCLFWVYSSYIQMGVTIMSSNEPHSLLSFTYFALTCLLGWTVTQNAPQVALTVLNGSPQLSMGEFLHAAGTAVAGAALAKRAAGGVAKTASAAHKGVNAAYNGVATTAAILDGAGTFAKEKNITGSQKLGLQAGALASAFGSGIKNTAAKFLGGNEVGGKAGEGYAHVGKGYDPSYHNKNGSQSYSDAAGEVHDNLTKQYEKKNENKTEAEKSSKPPSEQPKKPEGVKGLSRDV